MDGWQVKVGDTIPQGNYLVKIVLCVSSPGFKSKYSMSLRPERSKETALGRVHSPAVLLCCLI